MYLRHRFHTSKKNIIIYIISYTKKHVDFPETWKLAKQYHIKVTFEKQEVNT